MKEQQTFYRQIMKATSIFGGVQVFNIIIQIIRSKIIAVLLGPAGMGIMGLLNSTLSLITSFTNFGLSTSAVKEIASAHSSGDTKRISQITNVFKQLVLVTGLLGTIITLIFSPLLSQITFGNKKYTIAFAWISIALLLTQLSSGQLVVLQGMRQLKQLAKANIFGSAFGLLITLPLYYFFGIDGIVPGIIGSSLAALLFSWIYAHKYLVKSTKVSSSQLFKISKNMLQMGFMISMSGLLTAGASYIVRIFISRTGGLEQVGLYNAGFAIITSYVGLIFNAMATDYYPRLSEIAHDNLLCRQTINQQAEISILIISPVLIIFLTFINWVIILLYSKQFIAVNGMILWAALGMFFKAASWTIAFIFLAKGTSKLFFWNELIVNIYLLGFNLLGYHLYGLSGLGLSFALTYFFYLIQVYIISKRKFSISFDKEFFTIFLIQFSLALLNFMAVKYLPQPYPYIVGCFFIFVSVYYSYKELDKRLGLKKYLYSYLKK